MIFWYYSIICDIFRFLTFQTRHIILKSYVIHWKSARPFTNKLFWIFLWIFSHCRVLTHPHWLLRLQQHAIWRQYTFDAKPTYLRIGLSDSSSLNLNNRALLFSLKRGLECSRFEKSKFGSKLFKSFSRSSVCTCNGRKITFICVPKMQIKHPVKKAF